PVGPNFQPAWRLRDAHGIFVPPYSSFNVWGTQVLVDTLRASGSPYRLEVEDLNQDGTGSYAVRFSRITNGKSCETFDVACDVPHTDSLSSIVDSDLFRFSVTSGEIVSVTVVGE